MDAVARKLMHWFYRPLLKRYLQRDRSFRYKELSLVIYIGVFHPKYFGSSLVFAHFLEGQFSFLKGKSLLEIGCGSGLLSIVASKLGAEVTAVDINPKAVKCCRENAKQNGLGITVFESDLFQAIPAKKFDIIILNPPYFEGIPQNDSGHAWYAGEGFEFFHCFFEGLSSYCHENSKIWMILSEKVNLKAIHHIANQKHYQLIEKQIERRLFEQFIIFEIARSPSL